MTDEVRQLPYRPRDSAPGPIELLTFAELRQIDDARQRRQPQRPAFHVLALVRGGQGRHSVDFEEGALRPATLVWIRPGQVNQWLDVDAVEGDLVLFTDTAVTFTADAPAFWCLEDQDWELTVLAADHLRTEYDASPVDPILADLLTALLRRCTRTQDTSPTPPGPLVRRFRSAVEEQLHDGRRLGVLDYAAMLGYSPRTLERAVAAATGVTAKTWLDQRTILEARRLLAHTTLSAAACGRRLGFRDPANFSAFFTHHVGNTPGQWRRRL